MPDNDGPSIQSRPLTAWNQTALRGYIRQVHCFPFDGGLEALNVFGRHLDEALRLACLRTPYMAGELALSSEEPGLIRLHTRSGGRVPRRVVEARENKRLAYASLRSRGFPAGAFVGPLFSNKRVLIQDGPPIPVAEFLLILVEGGMLLCVFVYHSVTDGVGVYSFLSAVAECMNDHSVARMPPLEARPSRIDVTIPSGISMTGKDAELARSLHKNCPELDLVDAGAAQGTVGPRRLHEVSPVKFGGIFVFGPNKLHLIKTAIQEVRGSRPSTFSCLAALCWAFMTTTRLQTVGIADESQARNSECRIVIPTWWGDGLFGEQIRDYAGNAVSLIEARHGAADLFAVATSSLTDLRPGGGSDVAAALTRIMRAIETALAMVDEGFVKTRSALFNAVSDPRDLQYNFEPSDPRQLFFNSWRRLGADIVWKIPRANGSSDCHNNMRKADAVRKSQDAWNESAGLIMPGRRDQGEYEVVLSSDVDSMRRLRSNEFWQTWIDREVF